MKNLYNILKSIIEKLNTLVRSVNGIKPDKTGNVELALSETPDWGQNDPTAKDYIKNRPFFAEEGEVIVTGLSGWYQAHLADYTIPKVILKGTTYENISPKYIATNVAYTYDIGDYEVTFVVQQDYVSINPSDITGDDINFPITQTVYNTISKDFLPGYTELEQNVNKALSQTSKISVFSIPDTATSADLRNVKDASIVFLRASNTNKKLNAVKYTRDGRNYYNILTLKGSTLTTANIPYGCMILSIDGSTGYCLNSL